MAGKDFTLRATPAAVAAVERLRGTARRSYAAFEAELRKQGCRIAGYRLLGAEDVVTRGTAASYWSTTGESSQLSNPASPLSSQSAVTMVAPFMPSFRRRSRSARWGGDARRSHPAAERAAGRASD